MLSSAFPFPQRRQKALLWIGLGVAVLLAAFPYYSGFLWTNGVSALVSANSPTSPVIAGPVRSASLHIDGMFCNGCAAAVEYDASRATFERMQAAVSAAGYTASVAADKE